MCPWDPRDPRRRLTRLRGDRGDVDQEQQRCRTAAQPLGSLHTNSSDTCDPDPHASGPERQSSVVSPSVVGLVLWRSDELKSEAEDRSSGGGSSARMNPGSESDERTQLQLRCYLLE